MPLRLAFLKQFANVVIGPRKPKAETALALGMAAVVSSVLLRLGRTQRDQFFNRIFARLLRALHRRQLGDIAALALLCGGIIDATTQPHDADCVAHVIRAEQVT